MKPQVETIIAEEQAGFREGRSTIEQIFNLRIICEKYREQQRELHHIFIDFKKATLSFEYVWYSNTDFTASSLLQYYKSIEANVNSILKGLKQENDG